MSELRTIEIDFDVHRHIEISRRGFSETPNAVLRRLLGLDQMRSHSNEAAPVDIRSWSSKGVVLPHGTRVRMEYNGRMHQGAILDGAWCVEGERSASPSAAASSVARTRHGKRTNLDGWVYWLVLVPGETDWKKLSHLRTPSAPTASGHPSNERENKVLHNSARSATGLPPESEVIVALEAFLAKVNRPVTPTEAYDRLADQFHLTMEQRFRLMDNGSDCHWENRVRFARRKLVDAGIMARTPRGLWSLSKRTY